MLHNLFMHHRRTPTPSLHPRQAKKLRRSEYVPAGRSLLQFKRKLNGDERNINRFDSLSNTFSNSQSLLKTPWRQFIMIVGDHEFVDPVGQAESGRWRRGGIRHEGS